MPPRNKDPRREFGTIEIRKRDTKGRPSRFRPKYKIHGQPGYEVGPTFDSRARAEEWLHSEEELLKFGRWTPVKARKAAERKEQALRATSLLSYAEEWIKTASLESTTRSTYGSILKSRFEGFLDDATLRSFDAEAFKRWEVAVADAYPQTTARNRDAAELLRTIFNHAVKHELIDASPVRISTKKEDSGFEKPIPSRQELEALTAAMPSHYRAAISTLATCGLRLGEMCELRVKDLRIDRETGRMTIHVDRQIQRVDGEFIIKKPKGNKTRRVLVPLSTQATLEAHIRNLTDQTPEGLVFPNRSGSQTRPQRFREAFKSAAATAGCPDVTPHSLRHFAGTLYAQTGATMREIMDRLGHSTTEAAQIYQHVARGREEELTNLMDALLSTQSRTTDTQDRGRIEYYI